MEQSTVKDVDKLFNTVVHDREVNKLGELGNVRINEIELAVCLRSKPSPRMMRSE